MESMGKYVITSLYSCFCGMILNVYITDSGLEIKLFDQMRF